MMDDGRERGGGGEEGDGLSRHLARCAIFRCLGRVRGFSSFLNYVDCILPFFFFFNLYIVVPLVSLK